MYIERTAELKLKQSLKSGKIPIVLGPRQAGKTTLVRHVVPEATYFNLDLEVDQDRLRASSHTNPVEAMNMLGVATCLVIDEAQRMPETAQFVKGWHDAHTGKNIILLGSSSLDLLDIYAESLTGRNEKIYITPLTFQEYLHAQDWWPKTPDPSIASHFARQLTSSASSLAVYGSYPESVVRADKSQYLLNLSGDYLLKDVFQSGRIKSPESIRRLLLLLSYQVGSMVSINELAVTLGISRATVERYLELLEQTFVIFRLWSYATNQRKEIAKSQKIYFWDTGVRNALMNDFQHMPNRSDRGSLWENWVVAEIAKQNLCLGSPWNLYFWRSRSGSEVDLLAKGNGKLLAWEIKWGKPGKNKAFTSAYATEVVYVTSENPLVDLPMS
ncbi:MAG: ATP-binding protein [Patescibacteria group bacterium]